MCFIVYQFENLNGKYNEIREFEKRGNSHIRGRNHNYTILKKMTLAKKIHELPKLAPYTS